MFTLLKVVGERARPPTTFVMITNQKCQLYPFMEILKTVHESVVKLWFVFLLVCQESKILVKFGETDNASELWLIQ